MIEDSRHEIGVQVTDVGRQCLSATCWRKLSKCCLPEEDDVIGVL